MSHWLESHAIKNLCDHLLPEGTSFRMSLQGLHNRQNLGLGVKDDPKLLLVVQLQGIINLDITLFGQWGCLLVCILSVGKEDKEAQNGTQGEE